MLPWLSTALPSMGGRKLVGAGLRAMRSDSRHRRCLKIAIAIAIAIAS